MRRIVLAMSLAKGGPSEITEAASLGFFHGARMAAGGERTGAIPEPRHQQGSPSYKTRARPSPV